MKRIHDELPLFEVTLAAGLFWYAPGYLAPADPKNRPALEEAGRRVQGQWRKLIEDPFSPECLTLYLSTQCQLACTYCYATGPDRVTPDVVPIEAVEAASRRLATSCQAKGLPFFLVLHGGGEPTMHEALIHEIYDRTTQIAQDVGIPWRGHLATNGVMASSMVSWVAARFQSISISCDGPPEIQDRQRPSSDGSPTSASVVRTARLLRQQNAFFEVRTTITPATVDRQAEIVMYLRETLGAQRLRFEPVYQVWGCGPPGFTSLDAPRFIRGFLAAQRRAEALGCDLVYAGVRLDEVHGPYCDALRHTLHLNPDGQLTGCFFATAGEPSLEEEVLTNHRQLSCRIPARCAACVNVYHCARDCPDRCWNDAQDDDLAKGNTFRCLVAQGLTMAWLEEAASAVHPPEQRHLPLPLWGRRPFEDEGEEAWHQLEVYCRERDVKDALSIYVHIPFCEGRCGFCDCHATPLGRDPQTDLFLQSMLSDLDRWAELHGLTDRPVTTVHFGGGTPNCIPPEAFAALLDRMKSHFSITADTELALESTSRLLSDDHLMWLAASGFTRLHVGVQSLNDGIRKVLGRHETGALVLERLRNAMDSGFITTVDLIYGLPNQTAETLSETLGQLCRAGIHGASLYQLQYTERNKTFLHRLGMTEQDGSRDFALFQLGENLLRSQGYGKTHFCHYAHREDRNLYYRHRLRGEDLLAFGPTADGVLGSYHYRHVPYKEYVSSRSNTCPPLEGGLMEGPGESRLRPVMDHLLCGAVPTNVLEAVVPPSLRDRWESTQRLIPKHDRTVWELTATGSWFLSAMLDELAHLLEDSGGSTSHSF